MQEAKEIIMANIIVEAKELKEGKQKLQSKKQQK